MTIMHTRIRVYCMCVWPKTIASRTPDLIVAEPQGAADHWLRTADLGRSTLLTEFSLKLWNTFETWKYFSNFFFKQDFYSDTYLSKPKIKLIKSPIFFKFSQHVNKPDTILEEFFTGVAVSIIFKTVDYFDNVHFFDINYN